MINTAIDSLELLLDIREAPMSNVGLNTGYPVL